MDSSNDVLVAMMGGDPAQQAVHHQAAISHGFGALWVLFLAVVALICFVPLLTRAATTSVVQPLAAVIRLWRSITDRMVPSAITTRVDRFTEPARLDAWLAAKTAKSNDPLLLGDREAAARMRWPEDKFPFLYSEIPDDIRRPLAWDGRLPDGVPVTWLAWHHMTPEAVSTIARTSIKNGLRAIASGGLLLLIIVAVRVLVSGLHAGIPYPDWAVGHHILPRIEWYIDAIVTTTLSAGWSLAVAVLATLIVAPGAVFFATARGLRQYLSTACVPLATATRDSLVVYKHRSDIRATEQAAYSRQVALATANPGVPVIPVGRSTGIARARGSMIGLTRGQQVALDGFSIRQHVIAFGGTGEGKTEAFLKPMANRVFSAQWGDGRTIGGFITDGKGVLYKDILALPSVQARSDIKILGTDDEHYGVNLVSGMTPLQVSTMLKTVSKQVLGDSGDAFWTEQASIIFYHAAVIAEVLEKLGSVWQDDEQWASFRPWSLMGIGYLAISLEAVTAAADALVAASTSSDTSPEIQAMLESDEILISCGYVKTTWAQMAQETRSSIVANVNSVIGKFAGAGRVRDRFCTGLLPDDRVTDVDYALNGGILGVAVGEAEWGMVGQVIAVWLKTRLYIAARKRQTTDPDAAKRNSCCIIADEFQMLATSGGSESDAEFFNIARSTGVFMIAATQSLPSLQKRMGEKPTQDLLNNLRTKICMRLEELETLDYFTKMAGETFRGIVVDDGFYETQGQREIERPDVYVEPVTTLNIMPTIPSLDVSGMSTAARLDPRFILRHMAHAGNDNADAVTGSQQNAFWRQEDKERELRGQGLENRPIFSPSDLKQGQNFAFAYVQRAGLHTIDIIDLAG